MNLIKFFIIFITLILSGCSREEKYSQADNKLLCDPVTNQAFFVLPGNFGDESFIQRFSQADTVLCNKPVK